MQIRIEIKGFVDNQEVAGNYANIDFPGQFVGIDEVHKEQIVEQTFAYIRKTKADLLLDHVMNLIQKKVTA